jgi:hypothetical protein
LKEKAVAYSHTKAIGVSQLRLLTEFELFFSFSTNYLHGWSARKKMLKGRGFFLFFFLLAKFAVVVDRAAVWHVITHRQRP